MSNNSSAKSTSNMLTFTKGADLPKIYEERIEPVDEYLNFRPIRKFEYLNPIQRSLKQRAVALIN